MISYMQGTKFFKKPIISKSVIHKTVMDKDFLYKKVKKIALNISLPGGRSLIVTP